MSADLFTCLYQPGELRLSVESCADQWQRAQRKKPEPWSSLAICRGCDVGACHAGQAGHVPLPSDSVGGALCSRCHQPSSRIIRGRWCPSCYNRTLEIIKGRNARGKKPSHLPPLFAVRLGVIQAGRVETMEIADVMSTGEAAMTILRRAVQRVMFCRPQPQPQRQLTLFGGV